MPVADFPLLAALCADLGATAALRHRESGHGAPVAISPYSTVQNQATAHPGLSLLKSDIFANARDSVKC